MAAVAEKGLLGSRALRDMPVSAGGSAEPSREDEIREAAPTSSASMSGKHV